MKTKLLGVITLVLTLLCAWQWQELRAAKKQLLEKERAVQEEVQARAAQEHKTAALEQQQSRLNGDVANLSSLVAAFRATEAKYATNVAVAAKPNFAENPTAAGDSSAEQGGGLFGKGMSSMLAKMMKDPAMKDMMRTQQKSLMSTMYGGIAKDLNLTPDQNERLMGLLLDQHMKSIDQNLSLFAPKEGGSTATTIASAIGEQQKASDESIQEVLGEEKFMQYQEYKKTLGERMQLTLFKQQVDDGQSALQDDQFKQLMTVIREERDKAPPAFSAGLQQDPANLEEMFSGDLLEDQMQWQEQMNQRVRDRAGQILTPEQLKAYGDFQSQQLNMQRLGMRMAREMFGNKDGSVGDVTVPEAPSK